MTSIEGTRLHVESLFDESTSTFSHIVLDRICPAAMRGRRMFQVAPSRPIHMILREVDTLTVL